MGKKVKYFIQKFLGNLLETPIIPGNKTVGFSLVKSQIANFNKGKNTQIAFPCYLNKVNLGDYSYIASNSNITNTIIGKFCSIGPNFCSGLGIHPTNGISTSPMFYSTAKQNGISLVDKNKIEESKIVSIGNDVFIGANVTVLDGVSIGDGAIIGAGAVVSKDIPPYAIAVGVPIQIIKYRFTSEQIEKLQKIEWWNFDSEKLKEVAKSFFDINDFIEKFQNQ